MAADFNTPPKNPVTNINISAAEKPLTLTKKEQREQQRQAKQAQKNQAATRAKIKKMVVIGALLVAVVVLIVALALANNGNQGNVADRTPDPAKGPADALVVVKEYSDFQCPACKSAVAVVNDLIATYGDKIKFTYNDFPLPQHDYADEAAIGAQCALAQGKFFEYHDQLFAEQSTWAAATTTEKALAYFTQYAEELGLDMTAFQSCTASDAIAASIDEDKQEARQLKVNATPTFFVNGEKITGAPLASSLRDAINKAL